MRTRSLRAAARSGALLVGAGAATALGWSSWVETEVSTGATVARPAPAAPGALTRTPQRPARPVTIQVCQATPDGGYVLVDVRPERLQEYRRDPNTLVPAPAGGCPARVGAGTEPAPAAPAPTSTSTPAPATPVAPAAPKPKPKPAAPEPAASPTTATTPPTAPEAEPAASSTSTPVDEGHASATSGDADAAAAPAARTASAVRGVRASGAGAPAIVPYTGSLPAHLERLPTTGDETALLLFFGVDLLLLGAGLRLRTLGAVG